MKKLKKWQWITGGIVLLVLVLTAAAWIFVQTKLGKIDYDGHSGTQSIDTAVTVSEDDTLPDGVEMFSTFLSRCARTAPSWPAARSTTTKTC